MEHYKYNMNCPYSYHSQHSNKLCPTHNHNFLLRKQRYQFCPNLQSLSSCSHSPQKKGTTETTLRRERLRLCLRLAGPNPAQQGDSHVTASHIHKIYRQIYRPNLLISCFFLFSPQVLPTFYASLLNPSICTHS